MHDRQTKTRSSGQCYIAQAAGDAPTILIVDGHLSFALNDRQQVRPGVEVVIPTAGKVTRVLVGNARPASPERKREPT